VEVPEVIRSPKNGRLLAAAQVRSGKDKSRVLLEGIRVLGEVLEAGLAVEWVLFDAERRDEHLLAVLAKAQQKEVECVPCEPSLLQELGDLDSPAGVLAVATRPTADLEMVIAEAGLLLVAAGVQDPGNLGAMVRVAAGLGAHGVVTFQGGVSVYHPRAIRGASGTTFRIPVADGVAAEDFFAAADQAGLACWASASGGEDPRTVEFSGPAAILLGGEGRGLAETWTQACAGTLGIPLQRGVESLNVATAAAVLIHSLVAGGKKT